MHVLQESDSHLCTDSTSIIKSNEGYVNSATNDRRTNDQLANNDTTNYSTSHHTRTDHSDTNIAPTDHAGADYSNTDSRAHRHHCVRCWRRIMSRVPR